MNTVWKIIRVIVTTVLLIAILVPATLYVLLSMESVQNSIRSVTADELSVLLGSKVSIDRIGIRPFNRVTINDIVLTDSAGSDTIASAHRISAGIELSKLIFNREVIVDYALVDGLDVRVWRPDSIAPLNIAPILDHLRSDRPRERNNPFDLKINTVVVRRAAASYDVFSAPHAADGRFDPNHIRISDLAINAFIPNISNNRVVVDLDHLSGRERAGFKLRRLSANIAMVDSLTTVTNLEIDLSQSHFALAPITIYTGPAIVRGLQRHPLAVRTLAGSTLYPSDFSPFLPIAAHLAEPMPLTIDAAYNSDSLSINRFTLRAEGSEQLSIDLCGSVANISNRDSLNFDIPTLSANVNGAHLAHLLSGIVPSKIANIISTTGSSHISASAHGTLDAASAALNLHSNIGSLHASARLSKRFRGHNIRANIGLTNFNAGTILNYDDLGSISGRAEISGIFSRVFTGNARVDIDEAQWKGYNYHNLSARAEIPNADRVEATVNLDDPNATALLYMFFDRVNGTPTVNATASLANISLSALNLPDLKPGFRSGAKLIVSLQGNNIDDIDGSVDITDLHWTGSHNNSFRIPRLTIQAHPHDSVPQIAVHSDLLSGAIRGPYSLASLAVQLRNQVACFMPALFPSVSNNTSTRPNEFTFDFTLNSTEALSKFFELPVAVVYPASIKGEIFSNRDFAHAEIDAPYILQGDKIYKSNLVTALMDCRGQRSQLYITSQFPTKKGEMILAGTFNAADNRVDTRIDWTMQRRIPLNGSIDFSTQFRGLAPHDSGWFLPVDATLSFNPGTINFGYDTWEIRPSSITSNAEGLTVNGFNLKSELQSIAIDGVVSNQVTDSLSIDLANVQLLPIFETLEVENVYLSGSATGKFKAASLLSDNRFLECPDLHVDSIGYNYCTIGDADIFARWDNDKQAFSLDADILCDHGRHSYIFGDIYPLAERLDLNFEADSIPVGFLKPFLAAFASDISGRASGQCHLFGSFKEIDLTGDVYADNLSLGVDFTNVTYTASDSVFLRPGRIIVPPTTLSDREGHTATIQGSVNHTFFKSPSFRFDITDARDILCYNVGKNSETNWYGKIYGDGNAAVYGDEQAVTVEANMRTANNSKFAFILSDRLDAADYSFIEFRDATPDSIRVVFEDPDAEPLIVREIRNRLNQAEEQLSGNFILRLSVDIDPDAILTLVMDEATNDAIEATGTGHVTVNYNSDDDDLRIYGAYTVNSGKYHFTLQDIIIKDFVIMEGSTINFDGDPYAVRTNLDAYYATNANISDLDESFLQDRAVANTNVQVRAILHVRGDIRQPDINFDLEFPTLTEDTYRKVKSIVSTNDMMNRQIIYLLALNRFYTPDYMDTTKGSELFSVASSTISSQLSSLLGKLSDNWTIAPNLRSDRGDFSDVEVDVALSSRLLNNRLLFNGNFGYREKSLNSNQFVGDFDIEYLLNPAGTWRLKAYNRYNDANYYVRSAATTQGIGIMYRRDFDNIFSFLRKKSKPQPATEQTDSISTP